MDSESFGEYIRSLRKRNNLSLRIVSSEIDIDQSTLSKIERNEKLAPSYVIKPLAKLFNVEYRTFQIRYLSEKVYREVSASDFAFEAIEIAKRRLVIEQKGTKGKNKREQVIKKIKTFLAKAPIEKAWLFGSFARDEAKYDSDIDLLIQIDKSAKVDLLDYIGITYDLEDLLERNVDVVQLGTLSDNIASFVNQEKLLIYEK